MGINLTGGTKVMSASAALAASELDIEALYIASKLIPGKNHPEPGSENLITLPNPISSLGTRTLETAANHFNKRNFTAAKEALETIGADFRGPFSDRFGLVLKSFNMLCETYTAWSEFSYDRAASAANDAVFFITDFLMDYYGVEFVEALEGNIYVLDRLALFSTAENIFESFSGSEDGFVFPFDLYFRALYEKSKGNGAVAMILFYRAVEAVVQMRFSKMGKNTETFPVDSFPEEIKERADELIKRVYKKGMITQRLGLINGTAILLSYEDDVFTEAARDLGKEAVEGFDVRYLDHIRELSNGRNRLIVIHGNSPSGDGRLLNKAESKTRILLECLLKEVDSDICDKLSKWNAYFSPPQINETRFKNISF